MKKWIGEQMEGKSCSGYVGGWRVGLRGTYDSPFGGRNVPTYYRVTTFVGSLWMVPS